MIVTEYLLGTITGPSPYGAGALATFDTVYGEPHGNPHCSVTVSPEAKGPIHSIEITDTAPGAPVEWVYYQRHGDTHWYMATPHWHREAR